MRVYYLSARKSERPRFRLDFTVASVIFAMTILIVMFPPQTDFSVMMWLVILGVGAIYPLLHFADSVIGRYKVLMWPVAFVLMLVFVGTVGVGIWPPFRVSLESELLIETPFWWLTNEGGTEIYPSAILIPLRLENHQSTAVLVKSFGVNLLTEGQTIPLVLMNTQARDPLTISATRSDACTVSASFLDRELLNHNIEPGDIVRGWAMFDLPPEYNSNILAHPHSYTFEIISEDGTLFTGPLKMATHADWGGLQPIRFIDGRCGIDLSKADEKRYP